MLLSTTFAVLFYLATAVLAVGLVLRIRLYAKTPAPLKIPTTPAPVTKPGVAGPKPSRYFSCPPAAMVASVRAVAENPVTMTLWALFILVATGVSVATFMIGFIVIYPILGHASWHVYRDVVDPGRLPPRNPDG